MRRASAMGIFSVMMLILAGAAFVLMVLRPAMLGTGAASGGDGTPAPSVDTTVFETRIAFVSERDGNTEIYTMKPDGSDVIRLTHNDGYDLSPQWSPHGARIAWVSDMDGQRDVYVMNADGSGVIRLTNTPDNEFNLKWSPTGMEIAYNTSPFTNDVSLMKISASGGEPQMLSMKLPGESSWSPDGTEIAFATHATAPNEVVVLNAASVEVVRSFENDHIGHVAWHPQESLIAFAPRPESSLEAGLWLMDSTHLSEATLVVDNMSVTALTWSGYGGYLAYYDSTDDVALESPDLYVLDMINRTEPLHVARVIQPRGFDWSPDEAQIVYTSKDANRQDQIYVVRRDQAFVEGYEHEILTQGVEPDWSPYLGPFPQPTSTPTPLVSPTFDGTATPTPTLTLDPFATGYPETATAQAQAMLTPTIVPTLDPALPTPTLTAPYLPTLMIENQASVDICYISRSETHEIEWGDDDPLGEAGGEFPSGSQIGIRMPLDQIVDLMFIGCDRSVIAYYWAWQFGSSPSSIVITDPAATLLIENNSSYEICTVNLSKPNQDTWGKNMIHLEMAIPAGESMSIAVETGIWDLRAANCDDFILERLYQELVSGENIWTLTDE